MRMIRWVAAAAAALLAAAGAPAMAQTQVRDSALPGASTLTGTEKIRTAQGSGCATSVSPCASVTVTPAQLGKYLATDPSMVAAFQPIDVDLSAIAALTTQPFGRTRLTDPDAATARGALGLGTLATQSGTFSGTSSGTNTGDQNSVSGNAGTATKLVTARAINGVPFDGTAPVTITATDPGAARLGANADITSLAGLATALSVTQGGTGRATTFPYVVASQSGSTIATVAQSFTTIIMNAGSGNPASAYSTSTGILTIPESGLWLFMAKLRLADGGSAGISYGVGIDTSNADSAAFQWGLTTGKRNGLVNFRLRYSTAGEQIRVFAYVDNSTAVAITAAELDAIRLQ